MRALTNITKCRNWQQWFCICTFQFLIRLVLTCFHLMKEHVTLFQPKTIAVSFCICVCKMLLFKKFVHCLNFLLKQLLIHEWKLILTSHFQDLSLMCNQIWSKFLHRWETIKRNRTHKILYNYEYSFIKKLQNWANGSEW